MCYYKGIKVTKAQLIELLERDRLLEAMQRNCQSGFDWSDFPIVKPNIKGKDWDIEMALWGFIPSWINSKEKLIEHRKKYTTLNATCENILESKMFRDAALNRRCLVPITHFFEWQHFKPEGAKKDVAYPYYIKVAGDETEIFFLAGIYNESVDFETGELKSSYAVITTKANELMEQIHNTKKRMPTILPKHLAEEWISDISEERIKQIASYQYDSESMYAHTIAKDFRATLDITQVEYEELPDFGV